MQIYIARDGQRYGPYDEAALRAMALEGRIVPDDLAWAEGEPDWQPLAELAGLAGLFPPAPSPSPSPSPLPAAVYHHVAPWKFVLLCVGSLSVYAFYWSYRNWRFIRERDHSEIMPFWRSVFMQFWMYPLADDICKRSSRPWAVSPGVIGVAFFVLVVSARLPDPWWLVSLFAFVPVVPAVVAIDRINRERGSEGRARSRMGFWRWAVCCTGIACLGLLVAQETGVIPPANFVTGSQLGGRNRRFLDAEGILEPNEAILFFYSDSFASIRDDGNILTTAGVVSYYFDDESGEIEIDRCAFAEIHAIRVQPAESFFDSGIVIIERSDGGDDLVLVLSPDEASNARFIEALRKSWKEHR
jgi:hypothetical protein